MFGSRWSGLLLCLILYTGPALATSYPELQHDPFSYTKDLDNSQSRVRDQDSDGKPPAAATWQPRLLATIVAGPRSMANVGGKVLSLGQSVDGYKLIEVGKTSATFEKNGQSYVLQLTQLTTTR
ncbi:MAG: hypothetical protein KDJ38_00330 [Gammaproteobacteria bacterium]|nr:hypothetical protein [Gammaproteobacteria bacterium]